MRGTLQYFVKGGGLQGGGGSRLEYKIKNRFLR